MKKNLLLVLKGIIIGLGKIIPGVSGAALAITLNIYEPSLEAFFNLKKNFYYNAKYLAMLGLGIILSIIFGSNVINFLLNKFPLQTIFLFVGMILGGFPQLFGEASFDKYNIFFTIVIFSFMIFIYFFSYSNIFSKQSLLLFFVSGLLDSLSSIFPGISGTALLMLFGTYDMVLFMFGNLFKIDLVIKNLYIYLAFFSGFAIGGYIFSKLILFLFKNYKQRTYFCIICFSLISCMMLIYKSFSYVCSISQLIVSLLFCLLGIIFTKNLNN